MVEAGWHTYQVLTKRSDRLLALLKGPLKFAANQRHIWWGVSVENRRSGLPRIYHLKSAPALVRFLSIEPLLEDLGTLDLSGIHWVIVGGESGFGASKAVVPCPRTAGSGIASIPPPLERRERARVIAPLFTNSAVTAASSVKPELDASDTSRRVSVSASTSLWRVSWVTLVSGRKGGWRSSGGRRARAGRAVGSGARAATGSSRRCRACP